MPFAEGDGRIVSKAVGEAVVRGSEIFEVC
jgi:hypothetical protein